MSGCCCCCCCCEGADWRGCWLNALPGKPQDALADAEDACGAQGLKLAPLVGSRLWLPASAGCPEANNDA